MTVLHTWKNPHKHLFKPCICGFPSVFLTSVAEHNNNIVSSCGILAYVQAPPFVFDDLLGVFETWWHFASVYRLFRLFWRKEGEKHNKLQELLVQKQK
jgi:hypothetical protein